MTSRPPGLDREMLERVLARAAELQTVSADGPGEELSEDQLREIGKEVGLHPATLSQALAEERTRVAIPGEAPGSTGLSLPAMASASRTIDGSPEAILLALDKWMQREECLVVQRRLADRITWEPRGGLVGNLRRGLNLGGRGFFLCRASHVAATVVALDTNRVLARIDADMSDSRANKVRLGGVTTLGGVAGGATVFGLASIANVAIALSAGMALVPVAIGALGAYGIARRHRGLVMRVQLSLEQALDQLQFSSQRRLR